MTFNLMCKNNILMEKKLRVVFVVLDFELSQKKNKYWNQSLFILTRF